MNHVIELIKAQVKGHWRVMKNGKKVFVAAYSNKVQRKAQPTTVTQANVNGSVPEDPAKHADSFRAGSRAKFIFDLLLQGQHTRTELVEAVQDQFGGTTSSAKNTVSTFIADLQRPVGTYSASRGVTVIHRDDNKLHLDGADPTQSTGSSDKTAPPAKENVRPVDFSLKRKWEIIQRKKQLDEMSGTGVFQLFRTQLPDERTNREIPKAEMVYKLLRQEFGRKDLDKYYHRDRLFGMEVIEEVPDPVPGSQPAPHYADVKRIQDALSLKLPDPNSFKGMRAHGIDPSDTVWSRHSTPHLFDNIDIYSNIGTGEGMQVYGVGLYSETHNTTYRMYQNQFKARSPHRDEWGNKIESPDKNKLVRPKEPKGPHAKVAKEIVIAHQGMIHRYNEKIKKYQFFHADDTVATSLGLAWNYKGTSPNIDSPVVFQKKRDVFGILRKARKADTFPGAVLEYRLDKSTEMANAVNILELANAGDKVAESYINRFKAMLEQETSKTYESLNDPELLAAKTTMTAAFKQLLQTVKTRHEGGWTFGNRIRQATDFGVVELKDYSADPNATNGILPRVDAFDSLVTSAIPQIASRSETGLTMDEAVDRAAIYLAATKQKKNQIFNKQIISDSEASDVSNAINAYYQHQRDLDEYTTKFESGENNAPDTAVTYEFELPPQDTYLDLDKTFNDQHPYIKERLKPFAGFIAPHMTGKYIYEYLTDYIRTHIRTTGQGITTTSQAAAMTSKMLDYLGINGNVFKDGNTRHKTDEASYNYVTFGDRNVRIISRKSLLLFVELSKAVVEEPEPTEEERRQAYIDLGIEG